MKIDNRFCGTAAILLILLLSGCTDTTQQNNDKLKVIASFYPMYDFAKNVGGDRIDIKTLIPTGVEPHEYEPTPSDMMALNSAQILILNGVIEDSWAPKLIDSLDNRNLAVVDTSKGITLIASQDADEPGNDPHIWIDPVYAARQVAAIRDALIQADPAGKDYYESNAAAYIQKLESLDAQFRALMPTCKNKNILITHATLAYFCKEYGCTQIPIEGVNAEGEPTPAVVAAIIRQAKEKNITVVFVEKMFNPGIAESIAGDIGGHVVVFDTVHGLSADEQRRGEDYLTLMGESGRTIRENMDCG